MSKFRIAGIYVRVIINLKTVINIQVVKMEGLPPHKQMFLLINSQHVSAQIGDHQVIHK
jgi:microcystin degradation protein MlrC